MKIPFFTAVCLLLVSATIAQAEVWLRGAAAVLKVQGDVELAIPEEDPSYQTIDAVNYLPGMFSCRAEPKGSIFMQTSNGVHLAFRGEGQFSLERHEGLYVTDSENEDLLSKKHSRMIFNQRRGELFFDSRAINPNSQIIIETPFGRISFVRVVLLIKIDFDYRSGIYDFTISCTEGTVRLTDLKKKRYTIYSGQRIAGAGSYAEPGVEVAGQTDQIREKVEDFLATVENFDSDIIDPVKMRAKTKAMPGAKVDFGLNESLDQQNTPMGAQRPRIIHFAPFADPITPFRGELKPPSDYQADLF